MEYSNMADSTKSMTEKKDSKSLELLKQDGKQKTFGKGCWMDYPGCNRRCGSYFCDAH